MITVFFNSGDELYTEVPKESLGACNVGEELFVNGGSYVVTGTLPPHEKDLRKISGVFVGERHRSVPSSRDMVRPTKGKTYMNWSLEKPKPRKKVDYFISLFDNDEKRIELLNTTAALDTSYRLSTEIMTKTEERELFKRGYDDAKVEYTWMSSQQIYQMRKFKEWVFWSNYVYIYDKIYSGAVDNFYRYLAIHPQTTLLKMHLREVFEGYIIIQNEYADVEKRVSDISKLYEDAFLDQVFKIVDYSSFKRLFGYIFLPEYMNREDILRDLPITGLLWVNILQIISDLIDHSTISLKNLILNIDPIQEKHTLDFLTQFRLAFSSTSTLDIKNVNLLSSKNIVLGQPDIDILNALNPPLNIKKGKMNAQEYFERIFIPFLDNVILK